MVESRDTIIAQRESRYFSVFLPLIRLAVSMTHMKASSKICATVVFSSDSNEAVYYALGSAKIFETTYLTQHYIQNS